MSDSMYISEENVFTCNWYFIPSKLNSVIILPVVLAGTDFFFFNRFAGLLLYCRLYHTKHTLHLT